MSLFLSRFSTRLNRAGYALGFGMGGFFDGILLHQILQWHHLLSALQTGIFGDVRTQVAADGVFHLLMYIVAAAGLWWLYRSRAELDSAGAARRLLANFWIGFGAWHLVDAVLSHWLLGIHRIRMDTAYPLAYDIGWVALFGIVPLVAGWWLRRSPQAGPPGGGGRPAGPEDAGVPENGVVEHVGTTPSRPPVAPAPRALPATTLPRRSLSQGTAERARALARRHRTFHPVAVVLVGVILIAAAVSLLPLARSPEGIVTVVLRPGASAGPVLKSLPVQGTRLLWTAPGGGVLVFKTDTPPDTLQLYRQGALLVGGAAAGLGGCLDWMASGAARRI